MYDILCLLYKNTNTQVDISCRNLEGLLAEANSVGMLKMFALGCTEASNHMLQLGLGFRVYVYVLTSAVCLYNRLVFGGLGRRLEFNITYHAVSCVLGSPYRFLHISCSPRASPRERFVIGAMLALGLRFLGSRVWCLGIEACQMISLPTETWGILDGRTCVPRATPAERLLARALLARNLRFGLSEPLATIFASFHERRCKTGAASAF